jgi:acyl-CoA thioesterase FadM
MPRTRLVQQETYEFRSSVSVQPRDVNYGGHLGNDALIALVGTARALVFHAVGLSELDLGDGRTGIVMTDLAVNYKAEGYLFDELLIETHVGEITRTGFRLFHRVTKGGRLLALVDTGFVAFNYASRRVVPVPRAFVKAVADRIAQGVS